MVWKDKYMKLRDEGLTDNEIGKMFGVTRHTLTRIKKLYEVPCFKQNRQGITNAQLKIAQGNGVTRRLALRRVREKGWSVEDAVNTPKHKWKGNHGMTDEEMRVKQNKMQREYYKLHKERLRQGRMDKE